MMNIWFFWHKSFTWQNLCENFSDPGDCLTPSSTLGIKRINFLRVPVRPQIASKKISAFVFKNLEISSSPSLATISSTVPGPRHLNISNISEKCFGTQFKNEKAQKCKTLPPAEQGNTLFDILLQACAPASLRENSGSRVLCFRSGTFN